MAYLITAVTVTDFKRIRSVQIAPGSDRAAILIAGKNAQGKSSILDALDAALRGKRAAPVDAVRHGADEAEILLELDGGALTVHRVIRPGGETELEVRDRDGTLGRPQDRLDRIIGERFVDPIRFVNLPAKDQREVLIQLIDKERKLDALEQTRARVFENRTDVGRDLKRAEGELARLPEVAHPGNPIDVAQLADERSAYASEQRAGDGLGNELAQAEKDVAIADRDVAALHGELGELERRLAAARERIAVRETEREQAMNRSSDVRERLAAAAERWRASADRRAQLDTDLARAGEHNRAIAVAEAAISRRAAAAATVAELETRRAEQTEMLDKIDARKLDFLAAAAMPVDGLGVDAATITLHDVPFAQASAAEKLRVAMAIAIASSPNLDDIWVRDGALLDEESLAAAAAHAAQHGKRLWIERVGEADPGAIVIRDGAVHDPSPASPAQDDLFETEVVSVGPEHAGEFSPPKRNRSRRKS